MALSYKEFKETLVQELSQVLGDHVKVETAKITVNNGTVIEGLQLLDADTEVKPVFRLKRLYKIYQEGTSVKEMVLGILQGYLGLLRRRDMFEVQQDPEKAKENLVARLVSAEKNQERLKEAPWMPLLDLAVQLYYRITTPNGIEETLVLNEMFEAWHMSLDEAVSAAFENMMRTAPPIFAPIDEMIDDLSARVDAEEDAKDEDAAETVKVPEGSVCLPYVLTNTERCFGAVWMADKTTLKVIARQLQGSFYILPSSVHECMILPEDQFDDVPRLKQMVGEVNRTQVRCEEVLSYSIYLFDASSEELSVVL